MALPRPEYKQPVVMIESFGAFSGNPLYNELQVCKGVKVSAGAKLLYTRKEIRAKGVRELSDGLDEAPGFNQFRRQKERGDSRVFSGRRPEPYSIN